MMTGLLVRFGADRRGVSYAEFALVLPVLLMLGFGIMELGNVLHGHQVIYSGVHDAARYLARLDDPVGSAASGKQIAVYGKIGGTTQRLPWWPTTAVTVTTTNIANPLVGGVPTYRGPDPIKLVRVATTATYPGLGLLHYLGLGAALTVTVYHEERVVGE